MKWNLLCASLTALCVANIGCGTPLGDALAGSPNRLESSISPGIYLGDIDFSFKTTVNGEQLQDVASTNFFTIIINDQGLPVFQPGGEVLAVGLTIDMNFGDLTSSIKILSVNIAQERLVYNFSTSLTIDGDELTGTGTTILVFTPPNMLIVGGSVQFISIMGGDTLAIVVESGGIVTS